MGIPEHDEFYSWIQTQSIAICITEKRIYRMNKQIISLYLWQNACLLRKNHTFLAMQQVWLQKLACGDCRKKEVASPWLWRNSVSCQWPFQSFPVIRR